MKTVYFKESRDVLESLLPITFTRKIYQIRVGVLSIRDKWMLNLGIDYKEVFVCEEADLVLNSHFLPNTEVLDLIRDESSVFVNDEAVVHFSNSGKKANIHDLQRISTPIDIVQNNVLELVKDIELLSLLKENYIVEDKFTAVYGHQLFAGENVSIKASVLDSTKGPIYIGDHVEIIDAYIEGPACVLDNSFITPGAKLKRGANIGESCVIGGEVKNTIFLGFSNKGHEGYLGDSIIGEWCNLGALTTCSNLKNNWGNINLYHYPLRDYKLFDTNKFGVVMGDYTMTAIGTNFNTSTSVGVACNVFNLDIKDRFLPSFSWGKNSKTDIDKWMVTIAKIKVSKNAIFTVDDEERLRDIYKNLF